MRRPHLQCSNAGATRKSSSDVTKGTKLKAHCLAYTCMASLGRGHLRPRDLLQVLVPLHRPLEVDPVHLAGLALQMPVRPGAFVGARHSVTLAHGGQRVGGREALAPILVPDDQELAVDVLGEAATWQLDLRRVQACRRGILGHLDGFPLEEAGKEVVVPGVRRRGGCAVAGQLVPSNGPPLARNLQLDLVLLTRHPEVPAGDLVVVQRRKLLAGRVVHRVGCPAGLFHEFELILEHHVDLALCVRASEVAEALAVGKPRDLLLGLLQGHLLLQDVAAGGEGTAVGRELEGRGRARQSHQLGAAVNHPAQALAILLRHGAFDGYSRRAVLSGGVQGLCGVAVN
mmetsp:Transcript_138249/g.429784  ORF Transcript_138249/g.429784 Transcript_138249/m.429784 type:complete len:343 (+) Transcript_138249:60-1088(+)